MTITLKQGDCLELMKELPDKSVDLIIADPPYFRIMIREYNGNKHEWDNQWNSLQEYIEWCKKWFVQLERILKNNGSLYVFADDKISAYIQIELDKMFNLENNIVWVKPNNMPIKGWRNYRCYSPITERILFYSKESRNTNLENEVYAENVKIFAPIIEYMIEQKRMIKEYFGFKTDNEFNEYVNKITNTKSVVARHYFTYSQWVFPTEEIYKKLQGINKEIFKKEYEVFKKEYEVLKKEYEAKRRYFKPAKNFTDVWKFNITSSSEKTVHPTQKPIALIRRIVETSSKEGDIVLDPFMGSGTTGVACVQLNRNFIGYEINPEYVKIAEKRINEAQKQMKL
ncbi:MAG: site-specific DNA-methyltransferase [Candidatus Micrarchaeaceae archaeon]